MTNFKKTIAAISSAVAMFLSTQTSAEEPLNIYKFTLKKPELKVLIHDRQEALKSRTISASQGFDDFRNNVFHEPFEGGLYIVNGDTTIQTEDELEAFFEKEIFLDWPSTTFGALILGTEKGKVTGWDNVQKKSISYCVSKTFGSRYNTVVLEMAAATAAWENESDIDFIHVQALDGNCTRNTQDVVFDVRPIDVGGRYLARAFFPNYSRENRNILIDPSAFVQKPGSKLTLTGILRHELGHTLGFRHEHTRPESGACFEDENFVPLGSYDAFSVMHYPQCNGLADWSLTLSAQDKLGVACLYGPRVGAPFDANACVIN